MRVLLIILQTIFLIFFTGLILLFLYAYTCNIEQVGTELNLPSRIVIFVFGNIVTDILIFLVLATLNIWFALGPLRKVEDPVRRTLLHLSIVVIQVIFLLTLSVFVAIAPLLVIFQ